MSNEYIKFRFRHEQNGSTVGLVLPFTTYRGTSITDLSRMFPMSEASKMHLLDCSDVYPTFEAAMLHNFDA